MLAMAHRKPPEPTQAQLEAAARRLARPHRFRTLDEALADDTWRKLVRGMAPAIAERERENQRRQAQQPSPEPRIAAPRPAPVITRTPWQWARRTAGQPDLFDPRRAAANDLDEPDEPTDDPR